MAKFNPIAALLAFIAVLGLQLWAGLQTTGGDIAQLMDVPSFVLVVLPAMLLPLGVMGWNVLDIIKFPRFWSIAREGAYLGAGTGLLIGLVAMLANLDDPASIGPQMGVALIVWLYAFGLDLVILYPMQKITEGQTDSAEGTQEDEPSKTIRYSGNFL